MLKFITRRKAIILLLMLALITIIGARCVEEGRTYWINSDTEVRHNSSCQYYGNTEHGYYTDEKIGNPCGICGG